MTDLFLAVVVVGAIMTFGALISVGNERQRQAIDALHQAYNQWAVHDLYIKRERLTREIKVNDPQGWLNEIVAKVYGYDLNLQIIESFEEPQALVCTCDDGKATLIFSPYSPTQICRLKRNKQNRLSKYADRNPLRALTRQSKAYELTILNGGILFDLELPIAWKALTGGTANKLWLYHLH